MRILVPGAVLVLVPLLFASCVPGGGASGSSSQVLLPVDGDPTIAVSLWVRTGSVDDPPGKEGLAWLTGQMLAQGGTESRSYQEILDALYPMAASYGVRVDKQMTTLTGRVHRDNAEAYFDLFVEAFGMPAFDEEDFERIRTNGLNFLTKSLRYASDEELAKAALTGFVFEGTPYAHPVAGTVAGLEAITLDDVRAFYARHYTPGNTTLGLAGGFTGALAERLEAARAGLPEAAADAPAAKADVEARAVEGRSVLLVDKEGADASISFGVPIDVRRGEKDFYALWIANSWLGEHRNSSSHLYSVIRETRGMNYGDYSYIEAFPEGGQREVPPVNVARDHQLFEIWIRTLPNDWAHFAIRAAIREIDDLVENGMTEDELELTRSFLQKYMLNYAPTTATRLGYAIDDRFYGIDDGHLERMREHLAGLTLEDVNGAIRRHLSSENLKLAIVTGEAARLAEALGTDAPSPVSYPSPKPPEVLEEDREIQAYPLGIAPEAITIVPLEEMFAG